MSIANGNYSNVLVGILAGGKSAGRRVVQSPVVNEIKFRGERAAQVRNTLGLTQTELAHQISKRFPSAGVEPPHISAIESGARRPSIDLAIALSIVLESSLDYLCGTIDYDRGLNGHDEVTVVTRSEDLRRDIQTIANPFLELSESDRQIVIKLVLRLAYSDDDILTTNEKRFRRVVTSLSEKVGSDVVRDIAAAYGVTVDT